MASISSIAILGGGVGGLSAAHELAERGFKVVVYERQPTFGGKARSTSVPGTGTGGRMDLPGEHGFRFFPGFYKHITQLREPARTYERRGQAEHEAIDGSEIGRPTPGTMADQQLVLEYKRLGGDSADAAGAKQLREGDHQVDDEDEQFAHAANRTMFVSARKTVPRGRIASQYEFATDSSVAPAQLGATRESPMAGDSRPQPWQQRLVNHRGATRERLNPNAGLKVHLPILSSLSRL